MSELAHTGVDLGKNPPLRILHGKLASPSRFFPRDVALAQKLGMPENTVLISLLESTENAYSHFQRDLLISKTSDAPIITMTGYPFSGPVDVFSWKKREGVSASSKKEEEEMALVGRVQMEQVEEFEDAVEVHRARIAKMPVNEISTAEGVAIYQALQHAVPQH